MLCERDRPQQLDEVRPGQWIETNPEPAMFGEAMALVDARMNELAAVMGAELKKLPLLKRFWLRIRMKVGR